MEVFGHFVFPRFSGFFRAFFGLSPLFIGFFGLFYLLFILDILFYPLYRAVNKNVSEKQIKIHFTSRLEKYLNTKKRIST